MPGPREFARLGTGEIRDAFLLRDLFSPGELRLVVTDMDRMAIGGAMPSAPLQLPGCSDFGTSYFAERREIGVVNLGATGHVGVGENMYSLAPLDFLYIGAGHEEIYFERCGESLPRFYFLSCPAHAPLPVRHVARRDVEVETIGDASAASRRHLRKFIHPGGALSCQLVMGMTDLESGSVWNTMPPHTHSRRSEVYLYTGLGDGAVLHLLGEPQETRHVVAAEYDAVLSPSWSLHCGAGTRPYSFVWGMAGENQSFQDMDAVGVNQLR